VQTLAAFPDQSLLALVARSDDTALALLYDRHSRAAYGLALRVLRNRALAEDAVQDAFLQCWRTADRFTGASSVRAWIMLLVHRRAVDLVRHEERRRRPTFEPITNQTHRPGDEEAIRSLTAMRVRMALASLPDSERELLELAYYGGLTQSQLAERLQLPLGTVKSRMFAGLARLRELLADEEPAHATTPASKPQAATTWSTGRGAVRRARTVPATRHAARPKSQVATRGD
jgi:RNA polymerase sigma factor (sigma-70 family)